MFQRRPTDGDRTPSPRADTAPCVGCGLCCDGTIYSKAAAETHEEEALAAAGLSVVHEDGKTYFEHPCRFSREGLCTIYDTERFGICHTYRCKLLEGYQAGRVELQDARDKVERALALRLAVIEEEPSAALGRHRKQLRTALEGTGERPKLQLKMVALDFYLAKWFGKISAKDSSDVHSAPNDTSVNSR